MKPDLLTAKVTADSYRQHRTDFFNRLDRRMIYGVRQTGRPTTTPPLNLNDHHILHDLFKQEPGLDFRLKGYEGARKVVFLQKRG